MALEFFVSGKSSSLLPLMGSPVSAGFPSPAEDHVQLELDLNRHLIKNPHTTFLSRVKGNSMRDVNIHDGDILVIDRSLSWKKGDIAVCFINGEFTVKSLELDEHGYHLRSRAEDDPEYPQKIYIRENDDILIWGIVTYVIHKISSR